MATRRKSSIPPGLKGAAYEIWLAGLGAFNLAGKEGGRIFKALVEKGLEQKEVNRKWAEDLSDRTEGMKEDAKDLLGKVTAPIEEGLATAMQRLGVPTRDEIIKLTHRVEELTRHVNKAKAKPVAKARKPAPKPKPRAAAKAKPRRKPAEAPQVTGA